MPSPYELVPRPLDSLICESAKWKSRVESPEAAEAVAVPEASPPNVTARSQPIAVRALRTIAGCQIAPDADNPACSTATIPSAMHVYSGEAQDDSAPQGAPWTCGGSTAALPLRAPMATTPTLSGGARPRCCEPHSS